MRKLFTIFLALFLVLSLSGAVFAAEGDADSVVPTEPESTQEEQQTTPVEYGAEDITKATWQVTVPSLLTIGGSNPDGNKGVVEVEGTCAPSLNISVSTDSTLTMYLNGESNSDYAAVPVDFDGIALPGHYTEKVYATETVTVDAYNTMSEIMFGTWKGTLTFTISSEKNSNYEYGNGVETLPADAVVVRIASAGELVAFATSPEASGEKTYVLLTADIDLEDLEGKTWTTIANFAGTFDGKGHTISNMNANLFGTVSGTVKNLNVDTVNVVNTAKGGANGFIKTVAAGGLIDNCKVSHVDISWAAGLSDMTDGFGGVISTVSAGATVQNCEFTDISVTTYSKTKRTGGVFDGISGTVKDCIFSAVTFAVVDDEGKAAYITSYGGGFAAVVNGGAVVEDCTIKDMTVTADYAQNGGGIFGKAFISGQTGDITLKDINVEGLKATIGTMKFTNGAYTNFGGFIGQVDSRSNAITLNVANCHINGLDMTLASVSTSESPAAGFISNINGNANILGCSVEGKIDGSNDPFGIGGFLGDIGGHGCPADGYKVSIKDCVADVAITGNENNNALIGGFVSYAGSYRKDITLTLDFENCEAKDSFYGKIEETDTDEKITFTNCKVDGEAFTV